ncbi:MAG: TIGR03936 family radical SAM-associated protein [Acidimicrobiia bacterium]
MKGDAGFPVRIRFAKRGPVRFIGHRDVARNFERAFRVEELPLAFTLGFAPRPKVGFGLALSVGHESDAEYLDVELTHDPGADGPGGLHRFPEALSVALPQGIDVTGVAPIADRAPSLQEAVTAVEYRIEVSHETPGAASTPDAVAACVASVLDAPILEISRTRKGREVAEDVRPAIRHMELLGVDASTASLHLELATQPRNARPGDVVAALNAVAGSTGPVFTEGRVLRSHQWIERVGARLEPLEADPRAPVLEARAS